MCYIFLHHITLHQFYTRYIESGMEGEGLAGAIAPINFLKKKKIKGGKKNNLKNIKKYKVKIKI